jgi:NAD(P)-dependent dehydrogenase (short-subunit alcohol dehydrogenase family)
MTWSLDRDALRGRVAVVAGATRGAGRGIAAALGEGGATVVCTGRSRRTRVLPSDYDRAETVEETAELVTKLGGIGIAAVVDHLDPDQVKGLAERIRTDHRRIDVLVDDIWGGELLKGGPARWNTPVWRHALGDGLRILRLAIDTHLITSHHLLPHGRVGKVSANFFGGDRPRQDVEGSSAGFHADKLQFERSRRVRWFR